VDTTERGARGWKEAQRQGDFTENSIVKLVGRPVLWWWKENTPKNEKKEHPPGKLGIENQIGIVGQ